MSYKAVVTRIYTRPLEGADKLVIGSCGSYQVIVGKDTQDGQLGVFFEQDGQLSEEFATKNDLVRRKNDDGTPAGGMFEPNRRVKAIKLRGAKSEGFWCPLDKLAYVGPVSLKEGDQFDELNGHKICGKYFTPATQRSGKGRYKIQRDNPMFHKHIETGMFKRESNSIPDNATIYITEKLHGTSQRYGHVQDDEPVLTWRWVPAFFKRLIGLPETRKVWRHLVGSRNVVLEHREGTGFYGDESFRYEAVKGVALHKGEVMYGEVVGYDDGGKPIMATQDLSSLKDKRIKARFGDRSEYSYGCLPGTRKFYVYRITQVNEDGHAVELSWLQVLKRCKELGLYSVPELHRFTLVHRDYLQALVEETTEHSDGQPHHSMLDSRHLREGVVVRWESEHGTGWLKNKAFTFGVLEGYLKESDDYVDVEEAS